MRPAVVRIAGQPFRVAWVDGDVLGTDVGRTRRLSQVIQVRDDQAFHQERDTLLHEVIHACLHLVGVDHDETVAAALAPLLLEVLRSDPDLVDYLTEQRPIDAL